jgi:hypothetical protein
VCSTFTKGRGKNPRKKKTKENMVLKRDFIARVKEDDE